MSTFKAIALYNFQSSDPVELSLQKGDVVIVWKKDVGDGWCEGELNGHRGLFPKAFVKMIEETNGVDVPLSLPINPTDSLPNTSTPQLLTPQSNKKVFMETMLLPTHTTIDKVFDEDKASELFAVDHNNIQIGVGPKWNYRPPSLTITVSCSQNQSRSSSIRHHRHYEIKTKELKVTVQRKYKHFLWLYDQLAEKFPCISIPPIPIKQGLPTENEDDFLENRRRKLERFLNRVAKHPLLGSTKILHIFLIATTDKEWRIGTGKHTSIMKSSTHKGSKKFFAAPIYRTIHYPPYNVPINQLSAFDRFSKFSELLEGNLSIVMRSCEMLKASHGQVGRCYRNLGKDMQSLSKGIEPVPIVRHLRKPSQGPLVSLPSTHSSIITLVDTDRDEDDEEEDEEDNEAITGEWNWREDEKFTKLVSQLHDIGLKIRQLSSEHPHYQENIELDTIEVLEEYTNMIHTLPVLVRMHEEAMSYFNDSKQKGSKKDCETVRQDCETLNNILLSEFDYFSEVMIEDIQNLILNLLKQQAEYHRKLANEWENMYATFSEGRPTRKATLKRSSTIPNSKAFCLMEMQQRPASSDEKKDNLFKDYVNIEAVPLNDRSNEITKQHNLYTNIQQNVYENWTPTHTFNNATTPSSDDFSPSSPAEIVPVISPTKPIPPPLIIRRHEASTEPSEEPNTDSFIVPNLHYSQVNMGGPLNDDRMEQPVECRESSSTLTPSTPVKTKPHPPPKPALINSNKIIVKTEASDSDSFESSGEMEKGSLQQIHQTIPTKADQYILDSIVEEKVTDNSQYSPKMNTKLAKLTQLPPSTTLPYKKQSSIPQSLSLKSSEVSAPIASVRTLPKDSIAKTSIDDSSKTTELFKKLNERRQKLERQLSNDALPRQSNSNVASSTSSDSESTSEGVLRWTTESKEMDPNNSLVKYGIIEEGSTFTV